MTPNQEGLKFKSELEKLLERHFPKGECKERGAALTFFVDTIFLHNKFIDQASRLERLISEMGDEFQTLHCFSGKWGATSTRYLDPERVADYVARNVDCSGIVFGTVNAEGSTALEALENLSNKLNE